MNEGERYVYTRDGNRLIIVFLFRTRPSLFWGEIKKRSRNLSVGEAIDRAGFPSERISQRERELASWIGRTRRGWNGIGVLLELYTLAKCIYLPEIKAGKLTGLSDRYELTNLFHIYTWQRWSDTTRFLTDAQTNAWKIVDILNCCNFERSCSLFFSFLKIFTRRAAGGKTVFVTGFSP